LLWDVVGLFIRPPILQHPFYRLPEPDSPAEQGGIKLSCRLTPFPWKSIPIETGLLWDVVGLLIRPPILQHLFYALPERDSPADQGGIKLSCRLTHYRGTDIFLHSIGGMGSVRPIHRTDSCASYARHSKQKTHLHSLRNMSIINSFSEKALSRG
jgi:hypothetical protein